MAVLASPPLYGQNQNIPIEVRFDGVSMKQVLDVLEKKANVHFILDWGLVSNCSKVTYHNRHASTIDILNKILPPRNLRWGPAPNGIAIFALEPHSLAAVKPATGVSLHAKGQVFNSRNEQLGFSTVRVKKTRYTITSDSAGYFHLHGLRSSDILVVSHVGYDEQEVPVGSMNLRIVLRESFKKLDEVVTNGVQTFGRRQSPGNIFKWSASQPNQALATDFSDVLVGCPGILTNVTNGVPGSARKSQIRGQASVGTNAGIGNLPPDGPLYIINGVVLAADNIISQSKSMAGDPSATGIAAGGLGALAYINVLDIESIEVLKDAAATAVYGSRGANGVILITTKKGKPGKPKLGISLFSGLGTVPRRTHLLNTRQYVAMRREAIKNDGASLTMQTAPELLRWDTTRYTDFQKMFLGGISSITNGQLSVSGGDTNFVYLLSGALRHETNVLKTDFHSTQKFANGNFSTTSNNKRFNTSLSLLYSSGNTKSATDDITQGIFLAPNTGNLEDSAGNLNWMINNVAFVNPKSYLLNTYYALITSFTGSLQLNYKLSDHFTLRSNFGMNTLRNDETTLQPTTAQAPGPSVSGSSIFAANAYRGFNIEPQLAWHRKDSLGHVDIDIVAGTTFQKQANDRSILTATGYSSNAMLRSLTAATFVSPWNAASQYRYEAQYVSANVILHKKLYFYATARRDGSSRFAPEHRIGIFGAAGVGWEFSNSQFIKQHLPFLDYGKIKFTYGTTGNDQIGDYRYRQTYTASPAARTYGGISGLGATQPYNPNYSWEVTKKFDMILELESRWLKLLANFFYNRSSNQVVSTALPGQTGFVSVLNENIDAVVQNSGLELLLTKPMRRQKGFRWSTTLALTFWKNKLIYFPHLETSAYSGLVIDQPLNVQKGYHLWRVNPATGLYEAYDEDGNGVVNKEDATYIKGSTDPKIYGSLITVFSYKALQLEFIFDARRQLGINPLMHFYIAAPPGKLNPLLYTNQTEAVLDRWQKQGDVSNIQRLTNQSKSPAADALDVFKKSDRALVDASYLRLRSLSLSYTIKLQSGGEYKIYLQAQNLFTLTGYRQADPVTQDVTVLPPLRVVSCGFQLTL